MAQQQPQSRHNQTVFYDEIRSRRIALVDANGDIRLTLDVLKDSPEIRLWGEDGKLKASFGLLTTGQPALIFLDGYLPRVDLRLEADGQPTLSLTPDRIMDICQVLLDNAKRHERQQQKAKKQPARRKEG